VVTAGGRRGDDPIRNGAGETGVSKGLWLSRAYVVAMEEVAVVRRVAVDALADVGPQHLRDLLSTHVEEGSMVPGTLTLLVGRAAGTDGEGLSERAAGVQLIYDGLRLTRRLATDEPWRDGGEAADRADVEVLAADVLVARGFYLLSRSAAARDAVEVVRAFGRNRTEGAPDANLERDVLELALVAGADGAPVPAASETLAADVPVDTDGEGAGFPPARTVLPAAGADALGPDGEGVTSADL